MRLPYKIILVEKILNRKLLEMHFIPEGQLKEIFFLRNQITLKRRHTFRIVKANKTQHCNRKHRIIKLQNKLLKSNYWSNGKRGQFLSVEYLEIRRSRRMLRFNPIDRIRYEKPLEMAMESDSNTHSELVNTRRKIRAVEDGD